MKQSGLTKVVFPDSLEEIADGAFFNNISNVVNYKPTVKKGNFSFAWVNQNFELVADANGGHFNDNTLQKNMSFRPGYTYYAYNWNLGTNKNYTSNGFELEIPQKEGYTFIEYNTKSDGTGYSIPYVEGKYIINYPCDMTIYAIYQKEKTTITYNYGDGTFDIPSEELYFGENITNEQPIKNDYVFAEWNTKEDGTGIGIYPGQENPFKEDITLYAIYRKTGTIKQEDYINCCSSAQIISFENGEKIRVFSLETEWPSSDSNAYYEVSKDFLKRYGDFRYLDIDDDNYNELITLIATFSDCNEGGFFDTLGEAGAFYNQYSSMPNQFVGRILNPYKHTSNGGTEKYMHGLRFPFIYEHANEIAKKYDLRVFTNGQGAYRVGITPKTIEAEISIVDKTERKVLSGFTIIIRDEEGNLIDFITTEETPSIITLPIGHTYTIEELSSPENYDIGDNTVFTIDISDDSKEVIIEKGNPKSLPINPETVDKIFLVIVFLIASLSLAIDLNKKKETY
jgi:hypothetical protein